MGRVDGVGVLRMRIAEQRVLVEAVLGEVIGVVAEFEAKVTSMVGGDGDFKVKEAVVTVNDRAEGASGSENLLLVCWVPTQSVALGRVNSLLRRPRLAEDG